MVSLCRFKHAFQTTQIVSSWFTHISERDEHTYISDQFFSCIFVRESAAFNTYVGSGNVRLQCKPPLTFFEPSKCSKVLWLLHGMMMLFLVVIVQKKIQFSHFIWEIFQKVKNTLKISDFSTCFWFRSHLLSNNRKWMRPFLFFYSWLSFLKHRKHLTN